MTFTEKNYAGKDTDGEKYYVNTHKRVLVSLIIIGLKHLSIIQEILKL